MTKDIPPSLMPPCAPSEEHYSCAEKAAAFLGMLVEGNSLKADQVKAVKHDTQVYMLRGTLIIDLKPEIKKSQLKGSVPQGEMLSSMQEVQTRADGASIGYVYDNGVQEELVKFFEQDEGLGWEIPAGKVLVKNTEKVFSYVDKCQKCNGAAKLMCKDCNAAGTMQCRTCNGQGISSCSNCQGSGMAQNNDGSRTPCFKCSGSGRVMCVSCRGNKMVTCTSCNGQGFFGCAECGETGYWTYVFRTSHYANYKFIEERTQSSPEALKIAEQLGGWRKLAVDKHAEVVPLSLQVRSNGLEFPCVAFVAVSKVEFSVAGKPFSGVVVGLKGHIAQVDDILDPIIKPGINALYKLTKGTTAAGALMSTACKYRLIRDTFSGLMKGSQKTVYQNMVKKYPVGVSDKYRRAAVKYAGQALLMMSKGPRVQGMLIGVAASAVLSGGYFVGGVRTGLLAALTKKGWQNSIVTTDMVVWLVGSAVAYYLIRSSAGRFLRRVLPEGIEREGLVLPPAGDYAYGGFFLTFMLWLSSAVLATDRPDWLMAIIDMMKDYHGG